MEEGAEYFSIGSIVSCKTCYDKEIEGEVLAFDALTKMLIISILLKQRPASCGRSALNDIHVINLAKVSEVQVRKEGPSPPPLPPNPNTERLRRRACSEVEKKQHLIKALSAGVSPQGQGVFHAIRKTINEVKWQGLDIHIVYLQLRLKAPVRTENGSSLPMALYIYQRIVWLPRLIDTYDVKSNSYSRIGIAPSEREEAMESPRALTHREAEDGMFIYGTDKAGNSLDLKLHRKIGRLAEVFFIFKLSDGTSYQLPGAPDTLITNTDGKSFTAGGIKLLVIEPMRKWRVLFNGLVRKSKGNDEEIVHLRMNFMYGLPCLLALHHA
nr:EOG090X0FOW [Triops cancriformis]